MEPRKIPLPFSRPLIHSILQGGGTVVLKSGQFVSGGLYLKSNVLLEIEISAELKASGDITDYGTDTRHNRYRNEETLDRCFLYAEDAENIGITGLGRIDGNGEAFPNEGSIYRPMLLRFLRCSNIYIERIRLYALSFWKGCDGKSAFWWNAD